ncbi:MAG: hypothetical protein ACM3JD_03675 [Rudaea sp.]
MSEDPVVLVISGGSGASGEQAVQTARARFPDNAAQVVTIGNVRAASQLEHLLDDAIARCGRIWQTAG